MDQFTPAETRQPNVFEQIIGVFLSPTKTFQAIDQKPNFWVPLILIIVFSLIVAFLTVPQIIPRQMQEQRVELEKKGMDEEQIEQAIAIGEKFGKIIGIVSQGIIMPIIMLLIFSAILMFICNVILGGSTSFKKVFSISSYSSLIYFLGSLVKTPLILDRIKKDAAQQLSALEILDIHFSPAVILPKGQEKSFLYNILKSFDVFNIWQYIILAIGVAIIYKFSNKKAGIAVGILFIISTLFIAAMVSMFAE